MLKSSKLVFFILTTALLAACSTKPAPEVAMNKQVTWPERQAQLAKLNTWDVEGAIGVRNNENKGGTASLTWTQTAGRYTIYLFGPLGMGKVQIQGAPGRVTMRRGEDEVYSASSAEALLQQQIGWTLPVSNLHYWVRGIPSPYSKAKTSFDKYNHLTKLQQNGWAIDYQRYTSVKGMDLPSKIKLTYPGGLTVKLVISDWSIPQQNTLPLPVDS